MAERAKHAAKVAARNGRPTYSDASVERDSMLWTLEHLHLAQLEKTGDIDGALDVLREDLSDAPS